VKRKEQKLEVMEGKGDENSECKNGIGGFEIGEEKNKKVIKAR